MNSDTLNYILHFLFDEDEGPAPTTLLSNGRIRLRDLIDVDVDG